jgi:hypothetical protein
LQREGGIGSWTQVYREISKDIRGVSLGRNSVVKAGGLFGLPQKVLEDEREVEKEDWSFHRDEAQARRKLEKGRESLVASPMVI